MHEQHDKMKILDYDVASYNNIIIMQSLVNTIVL